MKMVMFTPGLRGSAIGRMTCIVVRELKARGVDLVVVRCETEVYLDRDAHPFPATTIAWNDEASVVAALATADVVVYHIGDNFDYHKGALSWIDRAPGVVCLHDFFLGHLFLGWACSREAEARRVLRSFYGDGADDRMFDARRRTSFIAETADTMPCTEWLCAKASAVVTHSSWGVHRVLDACSGPVRVVPLAYEAITDGYAKPAQWKVPGQLRILTLGHANLNKRMESVIRAIGGSPWLRDNAVYRHVGYADAATLVRLTAIANGVGVDFVASGELDDADLEQAFDWADIVSCLRHPSLEAASASAIEAMLHGKAIIVSDGGFYQEIEEGCCTRIDNGNEIVSIRNALEQLARDGVAREQQGARAQEWATRTFRAEAYAAELVEICEAAHASPPLAKATDFFFDTLADWGGDASCISDPSILAPMAIFGTSGSDSE